MPFGSCVYVGGHTGADVCVLHSVMDKLCLRFVDIVKEKNPVFAVDASQIEILDDPDTFYESIIEGIRRAKKRILISSLYIGTGSMETKIVYRSIHYY